MQSKTFCILPWIHIYANPDGSVLPCCIGHHHKHMGNVQQTTIKEIWNNENYKSMRKKMLSGEQCEECTACYQAEDAGVKSLRQTNLNRFSKHLHLANQTNLDGSLDEMNLKYFDLRWSNICNLKCRSCSSTYSSSWATEDNNLYKTDKKVFIFSGGENNDNLFKQFQPYFKDIELFYFAGGEPLLTDKHYEILEYLISIGKTDVRLEYNTNLTNLYYKNKSVIDLWNKFSDVNVLASLDSWGTRAEYIREGTDWNTVEQNIKNINLNSNIKLQSTTVVSIFNILTITDFLDYLFETNLFEEQNFLPNFYNLINPSYYSTRILDPQQKQIAIKKLLSSRYNKNIDQRLQEIAMFLQNSNEDILSKQQFYKMTEFYDLARNRNFAETFPELKNIGI